MKKKTPSKLLMSVLMCTLILGACSTAEENQGNITPPPTEGAAGEQTEAAEGDQDPLGKYEPPITITSIRDVGASVKFVEGESIDNNDWTREIEEALGVKIKNEWTTSSGEQYNQKLNVTIASNQLPDLFVVGSTQLKMLADGDQVEDLTQVYEAYASPKVRELLDPYLQSATIDGKLLAIPNVSSVLAGTSDVIWVRTDWLTNLGLAEPQTMDDLLKIAQAFTTQDPDQNKKDDTFGIAAEKGLFGYPSLTGFFNGFHAYPNSWIKNDAGELVFGGIQPEVKEALGVLQELYKTGQIDREFGVKDTTKVNESVTSGKVGIWIGPTWAPFFPLQDLKNNVPESEWKAFPILSIDDQPAKAQMPNPISNFFTVKKGMAHPEVVVKLMNLYVDRSFINTDFSRFGAHDGVEPWHYPLVQTLNPDTDIVYAVNVEKAIADNNADSLVPTEKEIFNKITKYQAGDNTFWADKVVNDARVVISEQWKNDLIMADQFVGAPTETMGAKSAALTKLISEAYTSIIMGGDINTFDEFVTNWNTLGGSDITAEVNAWYANTQK